MPGTAVTIAPDGWLTDVDLVIRTGGPGVCAA